MPKKVQMLHQTGFDRRLLNDFLQKKYIGQEDTVKEIEDGTEAETQQTYGNDGQSPEDGLVEACRSLEFVHQASNMQATDECMEEVRAQTLSNSRNKLTEKTNNDNFQAAVRPLQMAETFGNVMGQSYEKDS